MSPPPPTVPADLLIGTAIDRFLSGRDGEAFPVVDDGGVVGFISLRMARDAAPDRPVRDAMVGTDAVAMAGPAEPPPRLPPASYRIPGPVSPPPRPDEGGGQS